MKKQKEQKDQKEESQQPLFLVVAIDGFTGKKIYFNAKTKQTFNAPDHVLKVVGIPKTQARAECTKANELSLLNGWNMQFEVIPFEPYTQDVNESPFATW